MKPVYVPDLNEKLKLLMDGHEEINNKARLAEKLGVSQSNISQWINGVTKGEYERKPNHVPDEQLPELCRIFKITRSTLLLKEIENFEATLFSSAWQDLVRDAPERSGLWFRKITDDMGIAGSGQKRVIVVDGSIPKFRRGDHVRLEITLPKELRNESAEPRFFLLVVGMSGKQEGLDYDYIFPYSGPPAPIIHNTFCYPSKDDKVGLVLGGNPGKEMLVALLTNELLPVQRYADLEAQDNLSAVLNRIALYLNKRKNTRGFKWCILKYEYYVE